MAALHHNLLLPDAPREGAPLAILLHGRGATEEDLLALARYLPAGSVAAFPRAPFPAAPWGYGPGWAWYRFLGGTRPEPESFEESQRLLGRFIRELREELPVKPGPVILGGFSQGGTMGLAHALLNPGQIPLVVNLSGFLADHPAVRATPETVRGTAIFWGHGTEDGNIPHALAREGRMALVQARANLETRDYRMGHTITVDELTDLRAWLERAVSRD